MHETHMEIKVILEKALEDIQPMLVSAGRSIRITEADDISCTIELTGFCGGCACTENYTSGIEEVLREKAPGIKDIRFIQASL